MKIAASVLLACLAVAAVLAVVLPDVRDDMAWGWAVVADNVAAYERYLAVWPDGRHASEARRRLDGFAWDDARRTGTVVSYQAYLERSPQGRHASEARQRLDDFAWDDARRTATVVSHQAYLDRFPEGRHASEATEVIHSLRHDERLFTELEGSTDLAAYEIFLERYPGHMREPNARRAVLDMQEGRDIVDLIAAGDLEVETAGSGIRAVALRLRRRTPHPLMVHLPVGTFFVSRHRSTKNMVATDDHTVRLMSVAWTDVEVAAACANRPRHIPGDGDSFAVTRAPDQADLRRLIPVLRQAGADPDVRQAAVWIVTDDADYEDLGALVSPTPHHSLEGSRVIGKTDAARAMQIVAHAGIDITRKAIWRDRLTIADGAGYNPEETAALRAWLAQP